MGPFGGGEEMDAAAAARGWDPLRSGSAPPTMEGARAAVDGLLVGGGGGSVFSGRDGLGARLDEVTRRRGEATLDNFGNSASLSTGLPSVQLNCLGDMDGHQFGLSRVHSFGAMLNPSMSATGAPWVQSKTNDVDFRRYLQSHLLSDMAKMNAFDRTDLPVASLSDRGLSDALAGLRLTNGTALDERCHEEELLDEIRKCQQEFSCEMPHNRRPLRASDVFGIPRSERLDVCSGDNSGLSRRNSVLDGLHASKMNLHCLKNGEHLFPTLNEQLASMHLDNLLGDTAHFGNAAMTKVSNPLRRHPSTTEFDLARYQKAYLEDLGQQCLQHDKLLLQKFGLPYSNNRSCFNEPHFPYSRMQRSGSNFRSNMGSTMCHGDRGSQLLSLRRNAADRYMESSVYQDNPIASYFDASVLESANRNGSSALELVDMVDRVMEFGMDQYGSRFIQQKLETASADEKDKIFPEILSNAIALTTDVFGNYVIQKFFEFGTKSQLSQLADQLKGHILELSFQMYGCRVVQKVLEVVDMDRKINIVHEFDNFVLECIADQNGNHVIQKSIECVPEDHIQSILQAIFGQIFNLCTHQYGCRVIQRVFEHCHDPVTQKTLMDEIMQHVCVLTQDKFGNYVVQHVLQHGKPEERSSIIQKLSGQVVKMSQQKYASNVVEKCLAFGTSEERDSLIREIVGSGGNESFQELMKDQFGNYVVQKVLLTCDDKYLEMILSSIKVHLNELKNYTYGKHIVSRVEKLIVAGERRARMVSKSNECFDRH